MPASKRGRNGPALFAVRETVITGSLATVFLSPGLRYQAVEVIIVVSVFFPPQWIGEESRRSRLNRLKGEKKKWPETETETLQ